VTTIETVRGIDVSNNVDRQDWARLYDEGVRFAFARITEGLHLVDSHAADHLAGARGQHMVTGGYHFAWPNEDCAEQAAHYVATVHAFASADPLFSHWLDLEPYSDGRNYHGRTAAEIRAWAEEWRTRVQAAFPHQQVGTYAGGPEYQAGHVPADPGARWLPAYPWRGMTFAEAATRLRPRAGSQPATFWQFSGTPDLNLFYGSLQQLRAWAGERQRPAPLPTPHPVPVPVPVKSPPPKAPRVWVVKSGQYLGLIAAAFGVSVASLAAYNHIGNPNRIYPGERITAPPSPVHAQSSPLPAVSTSRVASPSTHPHPTSTGCGR
jgi:GH25 family lysozyme M1 (1,4-beta-N-acetylmuramidase)